MAADNGAPRYRHGQEIDIFQLISDAQSRWLKPIEVCEILRNHHKFKLSSDPADKPPSGSLYLYDRKALRYFRKDGHNWRKKKDGKTVREAHERLKAGSVDVLHCYYAHGEDNPNFQRRSYWLLEEPLEHIVLVHYREVTEGNRPGFGRATSSSPTGISTYGATQGISHLTSSPSEGLTSSLNQDNDETESGEEFDNTCMAEFPQHVPYFQKQKKDMDHDMLRFSHTKNLEESETSSSSLFRASGGPSSTVSYSSSSSVNPCQQLTNLENQKIKTEYADLAALENMDFSELLLQTPSTQKLTTANTLDSASWKELLAGANDMADGKSDWNNLLNQVAHVTENAFRQSGANSSVNEALGSHGATGCTSQVSQGFLDVIFPNSFGGVPESRETDLPAATTETVYNNSASEYNKLLSWRTAPKQPDKVDQVKSQLPEGKSYTQDVEGCSQFPKLEEDKQQVQNLQKQDSFGTWLLKELDPLFGERMPAQSYWQTPQMQSGDGSKMLQQIPLDNSLGPSLSEKQLFSIIDFSPEWAYCSEGTKVIVTGIFLDTIKTQFDYHWGCVFGEVEVPAEVLQQGVLRCNAPPHTPGNVSFYVTCNNRIACNEQKTFEYRADPIDPPVFDRFPASESEEHDQREEEMLLQIRFASILSKHEDFPSTIAESGRKDLIQSANEQDWQQLAALVRAKKWLYEDAKEMLLQTMLKRELKQWLFLKENGKGKGVLYVDEQGQGVLHLAAALGYEWAIAPILAAGIGVNFRDANGWTSLHWAAYCGREKVVAALLAADASAGALTDPTPMYPAGRTAADLAASRGHGGIAGYLAETSLTSHLSSLKLNEAEGNRISGVVDGGNVVETVSERNIVPPSPGVSEDQLSLKDTLAALRNASQAAARIQSAFRAHSFRRRQDSVQHEVDEFGLSAEEACTLASKQMSQRASGGYHEQMHLAAMQIQCKFRGWKGRKDFLSLRDHVVKIQAHVRGHQVRKKYTKLIWTVGILDKAILRWRRKGQGLRGFRSESTENNLESDNNDDEEFLKDFRRQKEEGFEEELSRVRVMLQSAEARQQYRRMLESFQKAKGVPNVGDQVFDDEIMYLLG